MHEDRHESEANPAAADQHDLDQIAPPLKVLPNHEGGWVTDHAHADACAYGRQKELDPHPANKVFPILKDSERDETNKSGRSIVLRQVR